MKPPRSLRRRIVLHFCTYCLLLLIIYSVALMLGILVAQDIAFGRQVRMTTEQILRYVEENGTLPGMLPTLMTVTDDYAEIPETLRAVIPKDIPGYLEINEEGLDYHAAVAELPSTGRMIYVLYNVGALEFSEREDRLFGIGLTAAGLLLLLTGWGLAGTMANRIVRPISRLAEDVRGLSFDANPPRLPSVYRAEDEIGLLSDTIRHLLQRIEQFTRREREFTAHASHELRTPAAIIGGAAELLREQMTVPQAPLERIERAVTRIEELIDTFLFLAREEGEADAGPCELGRAVADVLQSHQYLLDRKPVTVTLHAQSAGTVAAAEPLVWIAVANLIRNAFQYTLSGEVTVTVDGGTVTVSDTGPGPGTPVQGHGIGLTIVQRLCERMDWCFSIEPAPRGGTRATLTFNS